MQRELPKLVDIFCRPATNWQEEAANEGTDAKNRNKKQKSSELSFAALWLVPSPRYFAKLM